MSFNLPLASFAPSPGVYDTSNFMVDSSFKFLQDLKNRGIRVHGMLVYWQTPNWLKVPGTDKSMAESNFPAYAEVIAQYILKVKNDLGIEIEWVHVDEPGGMGISLNSSTYASLIKIAGAKFAQLGLKTKWTPAGCAQPKYAFPLLPDILQDAEARQYIGAISYNSWWSLNQADFDAIYILKQQYNIPVWVPGAGYNAGVFTYPDPTATYSSYNFAVQQAENIHLVLGHSGASVMFYWDYYHDFDLVDPVTLAPYHTYYMLKQLYDAMPIGSDIVESASLDDSEVITIAAKHTGDNHFMLWIMNTNQTSSKNVTITGLPSSQLVLVRTSQTENMVNVGSLSVNNGTLTTTLSLGSINTLTGTLNEGDTTPPASPGGLTVQ